MRITDEDRREARRMVDEVALGLIDDSEFDAPDDPEVARLKQAGRAAARRRAAGRPEPTRDRAST
ncbi:MAG TPA: hypothetical protein VG370_25125 [Chloroflexota bacterium]|nr:hypothetical protein [Chloroflexota bacterium]